MTKDEMKDVMDELKEELEEAQQFEPRLAAAIDKLAALGVIDDTPYNKRLYVDGKKELADVHKEIQIVLYGAGSAARYCIRNLKDSSMRVVAVTDTNSDKWGANLDEVGVLSPKFAWSLFPEAKWVASAISRPAATGIRAILREMEVETIPLWECLKCFHKMPSKSALNAILSIVDDWESRKEIHGQIEFRKNSNYDAQRAPGAMEEIYFPPFIEHLDDEHFVDCGAADGDSVISFLSQWESVNHVTAYEPDPENFAKLSAKFAHLKYTTLWPYGVGDSEGEHAFSANGDYSSSFGDEGESYVKCVTLDKQTFTPIAMYPGRATIPTFIKMDIEGAELEAIWGARKLIKKHSPVLAICAYHTDDHWWEIPALIKAINPEYRMFFRRYAEGAWETVWYAVPPERVIDAQL